MEKCNSDVDCPSKRRYCVSLLGVDISDLGNCSKSTSEAILTPYNETGDRLHPLLISSTNIYTIPMKVRRLGEGIFLKIHFTRSYLPGWIGPNSAEWLFSQENWWPTPTKWIEMLRIHTLLLILGPATWAKFSGWIWYKVHQFLTPKTQASTMFLTEVETRINYTCNAWGWILPAPQTSPDQILYFEKNRWNNFLLA